MRRLAPWALGLLLQPAAALAEEAEPPTCEPTSTLDVYGLGTPGDELARMASVAGAALLRPDFIRRPADRATPLCAGGAALPVDWWTRPSGQGEGLRLVPVTLDVYGNTTYPHDFNDGAVWEGKGVSSLISGGAAFRSGIFSAAVAPGVAWQQNAPFSILPTSWTGDYRFMNPWYGLYLDAPQRFGDRPFWTLSPGQSYLRLDHAGFAAGVSTENMWWGPAMRNSILMSDTAPGFPHAFAGTGRPVDIGIGRLEGQVYLGRLDRSRYFPDPSLAYLTALLLDYEPLWVPGLYVGFGYVIVRSRIALTSGANTNGLFSLYGRWVFPQAGVEVYGELARDDWAADFQDLMREPDHAMGFTIGLQRVWALASHWVRVRVEATDLAPLRPPRSWRPAPVAFYTHGDNLFYTDDGQYIGAAIGPGASAEFLGVDVLTRSGWYGGYLERIRRNEDVYLYTLGGPPARNDVELAAGVRHVRALGKLVLSVDLALRHRYSRNLQPGTENDARLAVELTYSPPPREAAPPPRPAGEEPWAAR